MDALRRSTSYSSAKDHPNMLRHTSAEELDAAHQLVSSARGERISPPRVSEAPSMATLASTSPSIVGGESQMQSGELQQGILSDSTLGDATGGYNQICRYGYPLQPSRVPFGRKQCICTQAANRSTVIAEQQRLLYGVDHQRATRSAMHVASI